MTENNEWRHIYDWSRNLYEELRISYVVIVLTFMQLM